MKFLPLKLNTSTQPLCGCDKKLDLLLETIIIVAASVLRLIQLIDVLRFRYKVKDIFSNKYVDTYVKQTVQ